jgi:hypothetical protein
MHRHELNDAELARIEPLLPAETGRRGRPADLPNRTFMNAIFYVAKTGVPWRDLRVPMRGTGTERPAVAEKSGKLDGAKGSRQPACPEGQPHQREEPSSQAKPFSISKKVVWEAYKRANKGAAGMLPAQETTSP